jgi:hypothetical protein
MHVRLRLDARFAKRWHGDLLLRLSRIGGLKVDLDTSPGSEAAWPANIDLLFRLERLIHRLPPQAASRDLPASERSKWPQPLASRPDLVIDLVGDQPDDGPSRVWQLRYDGQSGEVGLLASLLAGRAPWISLTEKDRAVASGRLGTEMPGRLATAFDDALAHTTTLIVAAVAGGLCAGPSGSPATDTMAKPVVTLPRLGAASSRMVAQAIIQRLYRLCFRAPHWRVGWRVLEGPSVADLGQHPSGGWRTIADDGHRFYADPFVLTHGGKTWLFVEEFPHATQKGVISAVEMTRDGPAGTPRPVLDEANHLSYPFVFERQGTVWMVPESSAAGTIDLYRAVAFPHRWEKVASLVQGIAASDATLLEQGGRWWMFATVRDAPVGAPLGLGSFSDALHLWSAPDFRGPWTPHARNPVLIDIASARPAGAIIRRADKTLVRPVQDCTEGYGRALGLARINRLDDEGFSQTVETTLRAGPEWPGSRLHTLNSGGGFEFIDGSARAPRLP